ncbi:hypothetical protein ACWGBH_23960 [Streptomyces massasporeus]
MSTPHGPTPAHAEQCREQSRSDWEVFLTHRTGELRPGGQMVILGGAAAK